MRPLVSYRVLVSPAPVNALNACATVVEALVDVDSKFVKIADKECDALSAEVKKWFKKLAVSS